jgi:phosphomethylpyrimidine synthase
VTKFSVCNKSRKISAKSCGDGERAFVIASVGSSGKKDLLDDEMEKARKAVHAGADAVTDHSFYGDIAGYHRLLISELPVAISAVANYEWAARVRDRKSPWSTVSGREAIDVLAEQAERGLDMITVHASLRRIDLEAIRTSQRLIPMTSKGGGIISAFMRASGQENPYFEHFDGVLAICKESEVVLSLGTSLRPASVVDRFDNLFMIELAAMQDLTKRAVNAGVKVMIEGIGHATLRDTPLYVQMTKQLCQGVPYRVLPMATDIALGYDHISGAIATAVAVMAGANAVTCISRSEHIGLPTIQDLEEAVIATRIACHAAQLGGVIPFAQDRQMARTRWTQGCKGDWTVAIHPAGAVAALQDHGRYEDQIVQCTMCGDYCGIAAGLATAKPRS